METEVISGYFVLENKSANNDDAEDQSDADSDAEASFLDADEEPGGQLFGPKPVRKRTALFQEIRPSGQLGKKFNIIGRIQLVDSWWRVVIEIRKTKQRDKYLIGYPQYSLREDGGVFANHLLAVFLNNIEVNDQGKQNFFDYLRNQGLEKKLSFANLLEFLDEFSKSSEESKQVGESMVELVKIEGKLELRSMVYKKLFSYLPRLVPKHFTDMIIKSQEKDLDALEDAIDNKQYVFGFAPIMRRKYRQDNNVEASLENMQKTGLFDKLSICHKDALVIYNTMKYDSRKNGHTYSRKMDLDQSVYMQNLSHEITRWDLPIQFLVKEFVIVKEIRVPNNFYFLMRLWKCENGISEHLVTLMERHKYEPFKFDVDFDSEEFEGVRKDPDQMKVAEAIGKYPIVVISGQGGCGKTTTVSATLNYAKRLRKEEIARKTNQDAEEMDDAALSQQVSQMEHTMQKNDEDDDGLLQMTTQVAHVQGNTSGDEENNKDGDDSANEDSEKEQEALNILLAAPTGKAASVLKRRSNLDACTLHTVKFSHNFWCKGPRESPWRFAGVEVLVVDESSMVSVGIFHDVLDILIEESNLTKIILLGDIKQLPSIDPGNFLADVFAAFKSVGVSIELRTNHRSESQLIVDNATRISNQVMPVFDPKLNFHHIVYDKGRGVIAGAKGLADKDQEASCELDTLVRKLLRTEDCLKCPKTNQVITFKRTTCANVNEICCKVYNKHTTRNSRNKLLFMTDDKVACNRNGDVVNYLDPPPPPPPDDSKSDENGKDIGQNGDLPSTSKGTKHGSKGKSGLKKIGEKGDKDDKGKKKKDENTVRLCNGEIYFITQDVEVEEAGQRTRFVLLDDGFQQVKVDFRRAKAFCKIRHAWANTIHKFQGSEAETIVYIVSSSLFENWQHVYTAVTRGKKHLYILSRPGQLEATIRRPKKHRRTTLKEKLKKKMEECGVNLNETRTVSVSQSVLACPTQNEFPKRLVPERMGDNLDGVVGGANVTKKANFFGTACSVKSLRTNVVIDTKPVHNAPSACSSSDILPSCSKEEGKSRTTAQSAPIKNVQFTSLKPKASTCANNSSTSLGAVNFSGSFRNDSQCFSDWGDSMVDEIDAIVAATQTASSNTAEQDFELDGESVLDSKNLCKELFPSDLENIDSYSEYLDENPFPFEKFGTAKGKNQNMNLKPVEQSESNVASSVASPCENFLTTVVYPSNRDQSVGNPSNLVKNCNFSVKNSVLAPKVQLSSLSPKNERHSNDTVAVPPNSELGLKDSRETFGTPIHFQSHSISPRTSNLEENAKDTLYATPLQKKSVSAMSPDLFSPGSPDQATKASPTSSFSTPNLQSAIQNKGLVSPKRPLPSPMSAVMRSPKVRKLAAYGGFCDSCLSPIRKGVDMITIEESPKRHWIHELCTPQKDN